MLNPWLSQFTYKFLRYYCDTTVALAVIAGSQKVLRHKTDAKLVSNATQVSWSILPYKAINEMQLLGRATQILSILFEGQTNIGLYKKCNKRQKKDVYQMQIDFRYEMI